MQVVKNFVGDEQWPARGRGADPSDFIRKRLVGVGRWAQDARAAVAAHASHDDPVRIDGEPGTGKEFLARLIHACSARCDGRFVTISCESVSAESLEAALFGSIRSLPSGRNRIQRGLVESVEGGTLYIDSISHLSSALVVKIARLIEHQEFRRLGDTVLETADVRVILGAADPSESGQPGDWDPAGSVLDVRNVLLVPPLRRRKADIEPLSKHFMSQLCQQIGKEPREITKETIDQLRRHDWPGNVSELKQVVEYMVQRSEPPRLTPALLPSYLVNSFNHSLRSLPSTGIDLSDEVKKLEISLLCAALKRSQGVQAKAAQLLGLKLTTLNAKINRYDIDVTAFK